MQRAGSRYPYLKMSMIRTITCADYVKTERSMSKAVCSFSIAPNGFHSFVKQPEFGSHTLFRRLLCIFMDVDTVKGPSKLNLLCACLSITISSSQLPMQPLVDVLCDDAFQSNGDPRRALRCTFRGYGG